MQLCIVYALQYICMQNSYGSINCIFLINKKYNIENLEPRAINEANEIFRRAKFWDEHLFTRKIFMNVHDVNATLMTTSEAHPIIDL